MPGVSALDPVTKERTSSLGISEGSDPVVRFPVGPHGRRGFP